MRWVKRETPIGDFYLGDPDQNIPDPFWDLGDACCACAACLRENALGHWIVYISEPDWPTYPEELLTSEIADFVVRYDVCPPMICCLYEVVLDLKSKTRQRTKELEPA